MQVQAKQVGKVAILILNGRFDADTAPIVENYVRGCIDKGFIQIVMDLADVPFIASAGLRVILATTKELRQSLGGNLHVSSLQAGPLKVFEISGLTNVMKLFTNVDLAASSFAK
ncbi:STAS domain-containing protein [bacterium]|nr:STAS domain-containing protein [bacterium]